MRSPAQRPRPDGRDEPGQRLGRVDRVDEDRLGPGQERGGLRCGRGRSAVAVAELGLVELDVGRTVGSTRRGAATVSAIERAQLRGGPGHDDAGHARRRRGPPRAARPGSRRSPTADDDPVDREPDLVRLGGHLATGQHLARTRRPPTSHRYPMTYGWPPAASMSSATRRDHRVAVGPIGGGELVDRRPERPGERGCPARAPRPADPDSTRWTARPALAPAAAVRRAWFDQRRPLVTSVSAPSASAAPTRNSRLRSLLPPNAERQQVLALDPDLRPATEGRREPRQWVERRRRIDQPERWAARSSARW